MLPNNSLRNKIFRASQILIQHVGTWIVIRSDYVHLRLSKVICLKIGFCHIPPQKVSHLNVSLLRVCLPLYLYLAFPIYPHCCLQTETVCTHNCLLQIDSFLCLRLKVNINLRHDSILVAQYRHRNIGRVQKR